MAASIKDEIERVSRLMAASDQEMQGYRTLYGAACLRKDTALMEEIRAKMHAILDDGLDILGSNITLAVMSTQQGDTK